MDFTIDVINLVVTGVLGFCVSGLMAYLVKFVREQREANLKNAIANISMQRDVLYRYFRIVVEQGVHITPEEFEHVAQCYSAYHQNGGNEMGTMMWERIKEHAVIDTGRRS